MVAGQGVVVEVKVENKEATVGRVRLDVELRPIAGAGRPPDVKILFEPAEQEVAGRKREPVRFVWRAALPAGIPALTYRGALVLRDTKDGKELGRGVLDVYVRSP